MPAVNGVYILLGVVASVGVAFLGRWWFLERGRGALRTMRLADLATGFVTDFFDTLGIYAAVVMLMSGRVPAGSETSIPSRSNPLHSHDA